MSALIKQKLRLSKADIFQGVLLEFLRRLLLRYITDKKL